MILKFIDQTSVFHFLLFSLTLGLAPFVPQPHIWEKLNMLFQGQLTRPMDVFDFLFHGLPWLLLFIKLVRIISFGDVKS